ncbi:hypothetical protein Acr_00g0062030 [Actinidia rufa]|uniref:CCHC-type domain-containing protein n=1 Tax=Actinidia rufa TaxID=165716 RepID=A0A7J0DQT5_9ERIC|nr:hypothetical protein Acr_00g0062030 [Actinidia rufa]
MASSGGDNAEEKNVGDMAHIAANKGLQALAIDNPVVAKILLQGVILTTDKEMVGTLDLNMAALGTHRLAPSQENPEVMPPRRGRGRRGAAEPEDRVDRIERILEGLVQVVHDVHNNNNHDEAPQQPAMPMPGAGAMPQSRKARRFEAGLRWNIKNKVEILRLPTHQEVLHAALIAEESLNEMSQFRKNRKKRIGGNVSRGQSSKRQSSGSSSGNSSAQQGNIVSQGSSRSNELPTCPTCQKKHWGECRMGSRACYGCGQEGHQIRDCPNEK